MRRLALIPHTVAALIAIGATQSVVHGQSADSVGSGQSGAASACPGALVRVARLGAPRALVGSLVRYDGSGVQFVVSDADRTGASVFVPRDSLIGIEVRRGQRPTTRAVIVGGAVGTVVGLLVGLHVHGFSTLPERSTAGHGMGYPVIGAAAGIGVGLMVTRPSWVPVPLVHDGSGATSGDRAPHDATATRR